VGASTHAVGDPRSLDEWGSRAGDKTLVHARIARAYNLPHVSVIDGLGLGPHSTDTEVAWIDNVFRSDVAHPSISGHKLTGRLLSLFFASHLTALKFPTVPGTPQQKLTRPQPLLFTTVSELRRYDSTLTPRLTLDLGNWTGGVAAAHLVGGAMPPAWSVYEDRPLKPGLIALTAGASIAFRFSLAEVANFTGTGLVETTLLKSYEHMGMLDVTLRAEPCGGGGGATVGELAAGSRLLASARVDCAWQQRISQQWTHELSFAAAAAEVRVQGACLVLSYSVAAVGRGENKVKLISAALL
jgi:hypothetical protein